MTASNPLRRDWESDSEVSTTSHSGSGTVPATTVWETFVTDLGEDLRAVVRYDADGIERIVSDRLDGVSDSAQRAAVAEDIKLAGLDKEFQEDLFPAGEFVSHVRVFDEACVVHVPLDAETGYAVSVERNSDAPLEQVVEELLALANG